MVPANKRRQEWRLLKREALFFVTVAGTDGAWQVD
jgi:hypothetical protein